MVSTGKGKVELDLYLTQYTKISSRLMVDLNVKDKTINLLEKNNGDDLRDCFIKAITSISLN